MTNLGWEFMDIERNELSTRLALFLRGQYPAAGRDKALAADLGIEPRTARNYFSGYWPGSKAWRAIVRKFGRDVLEAVFEPEINDVLARRRAEIRALERELATRKEALRALARGEDRAAGPEERAA